MAISEGETCYLAVSRYEILTLQAECILSGEGTPFAISDRPELGRRLLFTCTGKSCGEGGFSGSGLQPDSH